MVVVAVQHAFGVAGQQQLILGRHLEAANAIREPGTWRARSASAYPFENHNFHPKQQNKYRSW